MQRENQDFSHYPQSFPHTKGIDLYKSFQRYFGENLCYIHAVTFICSVIYKYKFKNAILDFKKFILKEEITLKGKIFVFSATGNSKYLALKIGEKTGLEIVNLNKCLLDNDEEYNFEGETIGFVFPVYAWGCPAVVERFVTQLKFTGNPDYVFAVANCGDSMGNTLTDFDKLLKTKNLSLNFGDFFVMPNNYLPLSDVDSKEQENKKLQNAEQKLSLTIQKIMDNEKGINQPKGIFNALLSGAVHKGFNKTSSKGYKKLHINSSCVGCGLCAIVCPLMNITLKDGKPQWGENCISCMGCINWCPQKAIDYGKKTENRGRYHNPNISINELLE